MNDFKEFIHNISVAKLLVIFFFIALFVDMLFYYVNSFIGSKLPPYPVLYEIFGLLKEIRVVPAP